MHFFLIYLSTIYIIQRLKILYLISYMIRFKQLIIVSRNIMSNFQWKVIQNFEITTNYNTPLPPNYYFTSSVEGIFSDEKSLKKSQTRYRSIIGTLLYMSLMTRPDLTYAVNYLARFSDCPHIIIQLSHYASGIQGKKNPTHLLLKPILIMHRIQRQESQNLIHWIYEVDHI